MEGLRARLRSEIWRHLMSFALAMIPSAVLAAVALLVLGLDGQTVNVLTAPIILGLYGPVYLLTSRFAWANESGPEFREALRATAPPTNRIVRAFVIGSPVTWAISAAAAALLAVTVMTVFSQAASSVAIFVVGLGSVVGAWVLVVAAFSVEYSREWAVSDGFAFPGEDEGDRNFADFIYLAVQVSTTYSSSDVNIVNNRARRLVTINSLTAFVFSTVIIALLVALVLSTLAN